MSENKHIGSSAPRVILQIAGIDVSQYCQYFEWSSFINSGYMIKAELRDDNHYSLKGLIESEDGKVKYLREGRKKPVPVKFQIGYNDENITESRIAYLTGLYGFGAMQNNNLTLEAIDPPSFLLNSGTADGRVYTGTVKEVIESVIKDFTGVTIDDGGNTIANLEVNISDTLDNNTNVWYMMRMDPKTFISSLIDWSSSISAAKSRWIVSCKDTVINIKNESDIKGQDLGFYSVASNKITPRDVRYWDLEMNNFVTNYQTRLITGGISAITGQYLDSVNASKNVIVRDENTIMKAKVDVGPDRAFSKPDRSAFWPQDLPATYIMAVPEHNNGDVGVAYGDYIDGRARQRFMNLLSSTMRICVNVQGDSRLSNSELLGVSTCGLTWKDMDDEQYFLHGSWILYGFKHIWGRGEDWETALYLYRIDHDAISKNIISSSV